MAGLKTPTLHNCLLRSQSTNQFDDPLVRKRRREYALSFARAVVGTDQRWVLAVSVLLGPTLLLAADVIGRVVAPPGELSAGIVTALVGAPLLALLVTRARTVTA